MTNGNEPKIVIIDELSNITEEQCNDLMGVGISVDSYQLQAKYGFIPTDYGGCY